MFLDICSGNTRKCQQGYLQWPSRVGGADDTIHHTTRGVESDWQHRGGGGNEKWSGRDGATTEEFWDVGSIFSYCGERVGMIGFVVIYYVQLFCFAIQVRADFYTYF